MSPFLFQSKSILPYYLRCPSNWNTISTCLSQSNSTIRISSPFKSSFPFSAPSLHVLKCTNILIWLLALNFFVSSAYRDLLKTVYAHWKSPGPIASPLPIDQAAQLSCTLRGPSLVQRKLPRYSDLILNPINWYYYLQNNCQGHMLFPSQMKVN